jgi:hypothetical protein
MFRVKEGVNLCGLKPEMVPAMLACYDVLGGVPGDGFTVTSAVDGKHSKGSRHYVGLAFDVRTRHIVQSARGGYARDIAARLTTQYDVVLESDHIHIEYDPER